MVNEIIGQVLGVVAMILFCLSYQTNTKRGLLIVQTAGATSICLSYLFLGAMSGFALNIICVTRNIIYYFINNRPRLTLGISIGLALAMGAVGALSWEGPISLLIILPLMANTVFMSFGNPQLLRKSVVLTSSTILVYDIFVFTIGGIISESLSVISSIIGIIRYRKGKSEQTEG